MSSNKQTIMTIKLEEPQDKKTCIYLHSLKVSGNLSTTRRFTEPCSYPYIIGTASQQNEVPLSLIRPFLSGCLPPKAANVTLEWCLTDSTKNSYPLFTTRHKITNEASANSGLGPTIVFARPLDWAWRIISNHNKIKKINLDARAHLRRSSHFTSSLTKAGALTYYQQHGISKRRRGHMVHTQQPHLKIIDGLRQRAEQQNQATGEIDGLLQVMQVHQYIMATLRNTTVWHHQNPEH